MGQIKNIKLHIVTDIKICVEKNKNTKPDMPTHDFRMRPMRKRSISDSHINFLTSSFARGKSHTNNNNNINNNNNNINNNNNNTHNNNNNNNNNSDDFLPYPDIQERREDEDFFTRDDEEDGEGVGDHGRRWSGGSADSADSRNTSPTVRKRKHGLMSFSLSKLVAGAGISLKRRTSPPIDPTDPRKLIAAIRSRDVGRVRYVLDTLPVNVNGCNSAGVSGLHEAALDGQQEIVQILLQHQADINVTDKDGLTCLDYAVFGGHFECARFLIENGATVCNVRDGMPQYVG